MKTHYMLVDYDNIDMSDKRKGIAYLADVIINRVVDELEGIMRHYKIRLYGGWYEKQTLTQKAQYLIGEISPLSPSYTINLSFNNNIKSIVSIELAYSLQISPNQHLLHTFRARSNPRGFQFLNPREVGCIDPDCPNLALYNLFTSNKCAKPGCNKTLKDLFYKREQKLVDSMIVADLIFYAVNGEETISIVSSDDDLWPGICYALLAGCHVTQVHTRAKHKNQYADSILFKNTFRQTSI